MSGTALEVAIPITDHWSGQELIPAAVVARAWGRAVGRTLPVKKGERLLGEATVLMVQNQSVLIKIRIPWDAPNKDGHAGAAAEIEAVLKERVFAFALRASASLRP